MDDNCVQILLGQWDNFGTVSWCEDGHPAKRQLLWGKPRHTSCTLRRHWSTTFKSLSPMKLNLWKTHNRSRKALVILRWKRWPAKPFIVHAAVVGRPFRCQFRAVATGKVHGHERNYFTSCDPHHDIYTFCYWHIFWHIIYSNLLAFYLTFYLAFYLTYFLAFYLAYLLTFYLAYLLALYLAYLMAFYLAFYLAFEVQRCTLSWEGPRLRSSRAHWARQVPGWGPAAHTELGRSQVEVQRCTLSWEGPRLRSSGAHWAGKVPGWGPAVRTELGSWRRACRRVGKAEVEVEVDADMVEEKLEEEAEEEEAEEEEDNSSDKI